MNKLQFMCLQALEEMTLTDLNNKYFDGGGIGYTKRVVTGQVKPHPLFMEKICDKFEPKFHESWAKYEKEQNSYKGW